MKIEYSVNPPNSTRQYNLPWMPSEMAAAIRTYTEDTRKLFRNNVTAMGLYMPHTTEYCIVEKFGENFNLAVW